MLLDAVGAHLAANGIGVVGTSIFLSQIPDSPDFAIGIFEYPGLPSTKAFGTTVLIENARFQVMVRSSRPGVANAYVTARNKAEAIYVLLDGAGKLTLSGKAYYYIEALGPPSPLTEDENKRQLITCNYSANKQVG